MNEWICIGKIVNTHGIKGELRILSDFKEKEKVFHKNFPLFIGETKRKEIIASYRKHKNFDMILYEKVGNINEVIEDKGKKVYIRRSDLNLKKEEYLIKDLIGFEVLEKEIIVGNVIDVVYNKAGILLEVQTLSKKKFYIPKEQEFIKKISVQEKKIWTKNIQGLML